MAFPNLSALTGSGYHPSNTGVPDNGVNSFQLGIDPTKVDPDRLVFNVKPQGPSVTGASFVSYDPTTGVVQMSFVQTGADAVQVDAELVHSAVW